MRILLLIILCVSASLRLEAATYYVDFDGGNDASAGTSTGTAWKTIPGARTRTDSGYQSATYGGTTITTSAKVQPGDIFKLKAGTTMASNDCSYVLIDSTYYSTSATKSNPITIERESSWGSGEVLIDGQGMTLASGGFGLFHVKVSGIKVDGGTDLGRRGIVFYRSPYCGISAYPAAPIEGPDVFNCYFSTNGTAYASVGDTTEAGLRWLQSYGPAFAFNCEFNGGSNMFQGITFGDSDKPCDIVVSNCIAYAHKGSNDEGIGMKGFGTNAVFKFCTNYFNYKGWDMGCKQSSGIKIVYKVLNSRSMSNENGVNMNGPPNIYHPYANSPDFYIINTLIHDNTEAGSRIYHGPMNFHSVGNLYYRNGGSAFGTGNLGVTSDNSEAAADGGTVNARIYNTILYKPSGTYCNLFVENYCPTTNAYSLDSDYNSWTQTASEEAVYWSSLSAGSCYDASHNLAFSYGANGPGRSSGNWYSWYSKDTSPPNTGTGHFHSDPNSKGTGATDTTAPPFSNVATLSFALTNAFSGTDLSAKPWYISEMGLNADGTARKATPDMGPQDAPAFPDQPTVSTQRKVQTLNFTR